MEDHMGGSDQFSQDIVENLPNLRAFARLLSRDHTMAEDMVQDTVVRALTCKAQFQPGTNLRGWLTVMLRNRYFNHLRRASHRVETQADLEAVSGGRSGGQEEALEFRDFKRVFGTLPPAQREALTLVGASGLSYEEAAQTIGCAVGTVKSRVSRARLQMQAVLDGKDASANRMSRTHAC